MKRILLAFLVLFLLPSVLWASDEVSRLIERSPYPEESKAYLLREASKIFSEASDIPGKLLLKKLREGITKGVPPESLIEALRKRKEALQEAKKLLEETGIRERETLLEDLAMSLELSVPPQVLREILGRVASNPKVAERFVDTVAMFLEVGVPPDKASAVLEGVLKRDLGVREVRKVAELLERARREGIKVDRVASCLQDALEKHENFALVEVELQNFIAANKPRPALRSGQGVVAPPPGISSGGTPMEEGGTPLEHQPSSAHPPTQEGGMPLE